MRDWHTHTIVAGIHYGWVAHWKLKKACAQNWLFTLSIVVAGNTTVEAETLYIRDRHTLEAGILEQTFIRVWHTLVVD